MDGGCVHIPVRCTSCTLHIAKASVVISINECFLFRLTQGQYQINYISDNRCHNCASFFSFQQLCEGNGLP